MDIIRDVENIKLIINILFSLASLVSEDGLYTGKIVIKSKNSQFKVTIPYRAHVLSGSLFVNENVTHFHLKDRWGFDEDQPIVEEAGSSTSSDSSKNIRENTKEKDEGDIVQNPIGMCKCERTVWLLNVLSLLNTSNTIFTISNYHF